jgi:hypothetical protein
MKKKKLFKLLLAVQSNVAVQGIIMMHWNLSVLCPCFRNKTKILQKRDVATLGKIFVTTVIVTARRYKYSASLISGEEHLMAHR